LTLVPRRGGEKAVKGKDLKNGKKKRKKKNASWLQGIEVVRWRTELSKSVTIKLPFSSNYSRAALGGQGDQLARSKRGKGATGGLARGKKDKRFKLKVGVQICTHNACGRGEETQDGKTHLQIP